jgi:hypothetical protein
MSRALSAITATPNQRASWLPAMTPAAASSCKMAMISVIQPQDRKPPNT